MTEDRYIRNYRNLAAIAALVFLAFLLSYWVKTTFFNEWRQVQGKFLAVADTLSGGVDESNIPLRIRQVEIEDLGITDRCVTCHLGIEDARFKAAPVPHRLHGGDYLSGHPVSRYGCTICHGGQGQAITLRDAFGQNPRNAWHQPLLDQPFIQSSCGRCHLALFSGNEELEEVDALYGGQKIFLREGCLGCHKARSVGGSIGPDLTSQGDKTIHEYNFRNVEGEQTVSNYLRSHFKDPEMVSPGSRMLKYDLPEEDLDALVTFTMALFRPEVPFNYIDLQVLKEFKGDRKTLWGEMLYPMLCSSCHGKEGEGKDYQEYDYGAPALFNRDLLRTASRDMFRFTLMNGRAEKMMASWDPRYSGIWETDSIVNFLSGQKETRSDWQGTLKTSGSLSEGQDLFNENCDMCHGEGSKGLIGPDLRQEDLLDAASRKYFFMTLSLGRPNTAMPSWSYFNDQQVASLIRYLDPENEIPFVSGSVGLQEGDILKGSTKYHYLCSRCHGEHGEGATGPAILNPYFQQAADDYFLYHTILEGRAHTAMHGWGSSEYLQNSLGREDVEDLITFMRAASVEKPEYIYPGPVKGDPVAGESLFLENCAECHGDHGEGVKAPALNNQEFLNGATNGFILATVSLGRIGTRMPSWGKGDELHKKLSAQERQDLVAFVRGWEKVKIKN